VDGEAKVENAWTVAGVGLKSGLVGIKPMQRPSVAALLFVFTTKSNT
jgi:hypothetical protein